jgi:hypothetical protein
MCCSLLTGCGNDGDAYTKVKGDVLKLPDESAAETKELKKMFSEFSMNHKKINTNSLFLMIFR